MKLQARIIGKESAGRLPGVSLILVAAAVAVMPCEPLAHWLEYDRAAVAGGQLWRILTCQLTHWSWEHVFWDAVALAFLGWVLERDDRRSMLACLGLSSILIPAVVHFGLPELVTYRGLSGIDSAVFVLLAVILLRQSRADGDRVWTIACFAMLAAFATKISFELITGATLFVDAAASQMLPVPLAHVVGAIVGAVCGWYGGRSTPGPSPTSLRGTSPLTARYHGSGDPAPASLAAGRSA